MDGKSLGTSAMMTSLPIQLIVQRSSSESAADVRTRIYTLINSTIRPASLTLSVASFDSQGGNHDEDYESRLTTRLQGKVQLIGRSPIVCRHFVQSFVSLKERSLYLSANAGCQEEGNLLFDKLELSSAEQVTQISDFQLGSRVGYTDFVSHFSAMAADGPNFGVKNLNATFKHDIGMLTVNFHNPIPDAKQQNVGTNYELRIRYENVSAVILVPMTGQTDTLRAFLILKFPPLLYEMVITKEMEQRSGMYFARTCTFNLRTVDGGITAVDFGRCNVLSLDFPVPTTEVKVISTYSRSLFDPWFLISTFKRFTDCTTAIPFYFASMTVHLTRRPELKNQIEALIPHILFPVSYAVNSCMSVSHQFLDDLILGNEFEYMISFLLEESNQFMPMVEKALFNLFKLLDQNWPLSVFPAFRDLYADVRASKYTDYTSVEGVRKIRRAVITPTHVILLPPHPFVESRLLRLCDPDFALRCHIRDDDDKMLTNTLGHGSQERQKEFLMRRIHDVVMQGVTVGPRTYHFMGSSSSQIRGHGLTLYAKDYLNRDSAFYRREIGDFSAIRSVGKFIARVGQAFSQMLDDVRIDETIIPDEISDIELGCHPVSGKPYNFTDGVGKVSVRLGRKFADRLKLTFVPSAFQIRWQGCKGLVVVDPTIDADWEYFAVRRSMNKFPSQCQTLELLKVSEPRPVFLNRPLINLLDQLGTPRPVLQRLLIDCLKSLIEAFLDEESALQCLRYNLPHIIPLMSLDAVHVSGISVLSEPFFRRVLDIVVKRKLRELKQNSRIKIPFDSGRVMFGVADETRTLKYGQVFVQYTHSDKTKKILKEEVMVTKNPCMHPGDVRKFQAVDVPGLRHIVDCIVFPTTGPRPHSNEMAGSDLDGDEYSVMWMKDLYFTKPNQEAMVFSDQAAEELNRAVEVTDQMQFFCEFIRSNAVGLIANAHLATSDLTSIFDDKCKHFAELYSLSLDFAKTGRNAELPPEDRPKRYPDFMEKGSEKSTYRSERALGHLYRLMNLFETALCDSGDDLDFQHSANPLINCEGWQEYEAVAMDDFDKYKMTCDSILKELSIESEEYLLASICQQKGKFTNGKKEDTQELLERIVKNMFAGFRARFEEGTSSASDQQKKAVAYYMTARVMQTSIRGKKWYGFPWIAAPELASLMQQQNAEKNLQEVTIATLIDSILPAAGDLTVTLTVSNFLFNWLKTDTERTVRDEAEMAQEKRMVDEAIAAVCDSDPVAMVGQISAGGIVVKTLKQLIKNMIQVLRGPGNAWRSVKLGMAAMTSLNKCFRTGSIDCLTVKSDKTAEQRLQMQSLNVQSHEFRFKVFHISLCHQPDSGFRQLVEHNFHDVLSFLKRNSNVKDINARRVSQHTYHYWLICAVGDKWSLANLSAALIKRDFYQTTSDGIRALLERHINVQSRRERH